MVEQAGPETLLADVREPGEYARAHIPGAINLPQADLASRLSEFRRDRRVILLCQTGQPSLRAAQHLKQTGLPQIVHLKGGTAAWKQSGRPLQHVEVGSGATIAESAWAYAGGGAER